MLLPWFMTDVIVMVLRQMLLPSIRLFYGRCYCHIVLGRCYCPYFMWRMLNHMYFQLIATSVMADVIARWQIEWPLQGDFYHVADVIAMGLDLTSVLVLRC